MQNTEEEFQFLPIEIFNLIVISSTAFATPPLCSQRRHSCTHFIFLLTYSSWQLNLYGQNVATQDNPCLVRCHIRTQPIPLDQFPTNVKKNPVLHWTYQSSKK